MTLLQIAKPVAFVLRALDAPIAEYVKEFHRCTAPTRRQRPKAVEHFSPKDMIPSVSCTDSSHPSLVEVSFSPEH